MISYLVVVLYILTIFSIAITYKLFKPSNKELLRKIIHIGIGPLIPIAYSLQINQVPALIFTGLMSLLILANYRYKIFPIIEDVDRKSYGTLFYCFSLFVMIIWFWRNNPMSLITGFLIMTFGDGLAGLIGKNIPSKTWSIFNQQKSLLGTITMFSTTLVILISVCYLCEYGFSFYLIIIAILATLLEQISVFGIDNLTVPIFSSLAFYLLLSKILIN